MKSKNFGIQFINGSNQNFELNVDVVKDPEGKIISGITMGATLEQNIACLLIAEPGDYKANLTLGVGLRSALLDENMLSYRHKIKEQFFLDGLVVNHLDLYDLNQFSIDAAYE